MARRKNAQTHLDALQEMLQDPAKVFTLPGFAKTRRISQAHAAMVFWSYRKSDRQPILMHEVRKAPKTGKRVHVYRAADQLFDAQEYQGNRIKTALGHIASIRHLGEQMLVGYHDAATIQTVEMNVRRAEMIEYDLQQLLKRA